MRLDFSTHEIAFLLCTWTNDGGKKIKAQIIDGYFGKNYWGDGFIPVSERPLLDEPSSDT